MNKHKNSLLASAVLATVLLTLAVIDSNHVRGADFRDVNVVNTNTNPVPVRPAEVTSLLFQTATGGVLITAPQDVTNIDVSSFNEIRVLLVNHPSTGGSDGAARVQFEVVEAGAVVGDLDTLLAGVDFSTNQQNTSLSRTFTVPARNLRIRAEALPNPTGEPGHATIDLLVYGR